MKVSKLLEAVRLYGLDVLFLGLLARLLNGLSKKLAAASAAISLLATRKKEARAQKCVAQKEKRAD
jgi:CRP-like cAMP-binding protein